MKWTVQIGDLKLGKNQSLRVMKSYIESLELSLSYKSFILNVL